MVIGIAMVRDEVDFIERTINHMAYHCDELIVADNGSTDGTRELLDRLPCEVLDDPEPGYYQSAKMSALATMALDQGAEWVIPFDADEMWQGTDGRLRIGDVLMGLPAEARVCEAAIIDHVATPDDPDMPWRREQQLPLRKVACRAVEGMVIHQGNHGVTYPDTEIPLTVTGQLRVHHFPYRDPEQFIRKARNGAAAYAATDLPEDVGAHWRGYGKMTDDELRAHFFKWFYREDPESRLRIERERQGPLVYDPCRMLSPR